MNNSKLNKQSGFSLLEVMVVLVIIGIIASMIVPNIVGSQDTARAQKAVIDIGTLESALTLYRSQNYDYPTTEQGLEALVEQTDIEPTPRRFQEGGYIQRLPKDPWGNDYQLLNPGEHGKMDIFSMGPDGEADTDDDIGNWNLGDYQ